MSIFHTGSILINDFGIEVGTQKITKQRNMNTEDIIARVSTTIDAPASKVWEALVTPEIIRQYMFGTTVRSDFRIGSPIMWSGEWQGKRYEDKGEIREFQPHRLLQYSHFSPLTGEKDIPENYHIVTITLVENDGQTNVTLTQDNNPTDKSREHSEKNWRMMLDGLKKTVEGMK
jgi:uncharacterized protein YndB with AHSA1/START domain